MRVEREVLEACMSLSFGWREDGLEDDIRERTHGFGVVPWPGEATAGDGGRH